MIVEPSKALPKAPEYEDAPTEPFEAVERSATPASAVGTLPPAYEPPLEPSSSSNSDDASGAQLPELPIPRWRFDSQPTNFLNAEYKHDSCVHHWIIDPNLRPPRATPTEPSSSTDPAPRPNLSARGTHGSMTINVLLINHFQSRPQDAKVAPPIRLEIANTHGAIRFALIEDMNVSSLSRAPLAVRATNSHAAVNVYLPRSFRGIIRYSSTNNLSGFSMSPPMKAMSTPLEIMKDTGTMFVGTWDQDDVDAQPDQAKFDTLEISSNHGRMYVAFSDELSKTSDSSQPKAPFPGNKSWRNVFGF